MFRRLHFTFPEGAIVIISCVDQKLLTLQEMMDSILEGVTNSERSKAKLENSSLSNIAEYTGMKEVVTGKRIMII